MYSDPVEAEIQRQAFREQAIRLTRVAAITSKQRAEKKRKRKAQKQARRQNR